MRSGGPTASRVPPPWARSLTTSICGCTPKTVSSRPGRLARQGPNTLLDPFLIEIEHTRPPGWLRIAADLVSLDEASQRGLGNAIRYSMAQTRADGQFHECMFGGHDDSGHWIFVAAAADPDDKRARARFETYLRAKSYQLHADWVADILGLSTATAVRRATLASRDWSRYTAQRSVTDLV